MWVRVVIGPLVEEIADINASVVAKHWNEIVNEARLDDDKERCAWK